MIRSAPSNALFAYGTKGKAAVFPVVKDKQVAAYNLRAANNSGSAINVGLCKKLFNQDTSGPSYQMYTYTASGSVYTNVTAAIMANTAENLATTTNNDGFVVSASSPFGLVGLTISTQQAGGTYSYQYWNGAWASLTLIDTPVYSSAADIWIAFQAPVDWVVGGDTGMNANQYAIRCRATTAPGGGSTQANALWMASFLEFYEGVANNGVVQLSFPDTKPLLFLGGETFIPYFGTAAAANQAGCYYSLV